MWGWFFGFLLGHWAGKNNVSTGRIILSGCLAPIVLFFLFVVACAILEQLVNH
jgi:hypothetical protein